MRVPVAVWQPCELLYTCYLLTYFLAAVRLAAAPLLLSAGARYRSRCPARGAANTQQLWRQNICNRAGPRPWNSLPVQLRTPDITYGLFRRQLKGHLFFGKHEHGAL